MTGAECPDGFPDSLQEGHQDLIKHDIVVVGGGLAGMRAAVEAAERGADVAIVSKMHPVRSHSGAAQGGINAALGNDEEDSPELHAFDCVKGSDYLGDQDAIESRWPRTRRARSSGSSTAAASSRASPTAASRSAPSAAPARPRTCYSADVTGLVILHTLWEQLERFKVKVYEEFFATTLCVEDGVGAGVIAYNMRTGDTRARHARRRRSSRPAARAASTPRRPTATPRPATGWRSAIAPGSR